MCGNIIIILLLYMHCFLVFQQNRHYILHMLFFILIFCNMLLNIYYLSYYSYNRLTFTQENVENVMCVWCVRGLCFLKGALPLKRLTIVTKIERTLVLATSLHFLTYLTSVSISISQNDSLVSQHLHSLNE